MSRSGARFISFEGGEGAGKSTQIKKLGAHLRGAGFEVVIVREPGGTPDAELLRDIVLGGEPGRWSPKEEMLIMYAARSQLVRTLIRPALARGTWVLSDRFADSTLVYQGYAGGVDPEEIGKLHQLMLGNFYPDMTFILDVIPAEGMYRVHSRADDLNQFEKRNAKFYKHARAAYLDIAKKDQRYVVIDAGRPPDIVAKEIATQINRCTGVPL